ncbi:DUF7096 domain-containing protein [Halorubrum sp. DTA98]|uniref:SHOCT domain-containing protein n=1 Tax=Halorubrum sp. DTA98 TaxID=3402163 RepID=UPI003AAF99FA
MKPGIAVLVAGLMVVGVVAAVPAAAAVGGIAGGTDVHAVGASIDGQTDASDVESDDVNESNATRPGERLGGVIGVQASEITEEVESRSFERRVAADRSDDERADAVSDRLRDNEARLDEIEARHAQLRERRDAGEITDGEYRARTARLAAETAAIERSTERSATVSEEFPAEMRRSHGIDDESIRTIRNRTADLSGPEIAEIARGIAGPNVGGPMSAGERPDHVGPPDANETRGGGPPDANRTERETPRMNGTHGGGPSDGTHGGGPSDGTAGPSDGTAGPSGETNRSSGETGSNTTVDGSRADDSETPPGRDTAERESERP